MKNTDKITKIIIIVIDIIAVVAFTALLINAFTFLSNKQVNKQVSDNASASTNVISNNEIQTAQEENDADKTDLEENKNDAMANTNISNNSVSDNSVSENSVSDDAVSENAVSENSLLSYNIPDAPSVMNFQSGTVINIGDIDLSNIGNYFIIMPIPSDVETYITGKSYTPNTSITLNDLRYIKVLHFNFNHQVQIGEIIVNESIANEIKDIFMTLFINEYEIQSMYLPDRYWTGDGNETDKASCDANNTSGFFYRTVNGTNKLSNHAMGKAIDINPQQNPYVSYKNGYPECEHENAMIYIDRAEQPHVITENDLCYQLFVTRGYTWGGAWNSIKDYQHFEK